jgi:integrase
MWTVPAERMKSAKEHRVPLSEPVVRLLEALPREAGSDFVFIGDRPGRPLSRNSLLNVLGRMKCEGTVHGFRSSFRVWGGETTAFAGELLEMALAHAVGNEVERSYRRTDLVEKRRKLMEAWAKFCEQPARSDGNVTPMRRSAS